MLLIWHLVNSFLLVECELQRPSVVPPAMLTFRFSNSAIAIVFFFAHTPPPPKQDRWQIIKNLDYIGTILLLGSVISILLALQNGGAKWAWDDSKTIGCIVGFGLMQVSRVASHPQSEASLTRGAYQIAFWIVQVWAGENATVPIRILNQRTIIAGCIVNFCTASCYFTELVSVPFSPTLES